jgi:hypothetical protein
MVDTVKVGAFRGPRMTRRIAPLLAFVAVVYLPWVLWPGSEMYTRVLTRYALVNIGSVLKLVALATGAVLAARSAGRLNRENPSRAAWWMLGAFLGAFFAGQVVLSAYEAYGAVAPLPSIGDGFFLLGYAMMIAALVRFVFVYRASGFPMGHRYEHAGLALASAAVFLAIGVPFLAPIAGSSDPPAARFINIAYPVLDFLALVPTIVLVRITWALRGGRVGGVWTALLAGLLFASGGDIVFAYATSGGHGALEPLIHPLLITSYLLLAFGAALQDALVRGD